jgi:hypothetical protein
MQGKIVKHINSVGLENTISTADLAKGQYLLNLTDKNKNVISKAFMVE